jgi:hypothetical protein
MDKNNTHPWVRAMLNGDFGEAWRFSDSVLQAGLFRSPQLPRHQQCIWDGTSLEDKRVLMRCYHGLGDTIQFIRYAPKVRAVAKEVIVWAQAPLLKLLESADGIDQLFALHDGTPEVDYDIDIEVMELPHIFRTTPDSIPSKVPYLTTAPLYLSKNAEKLSVGIVWKAGDWDGSRSMSFESLKPLFKFEEINLFILQSDAKSAGWQEEFGIYPGEFALYDFARAIGGLDLLITVDSMPAHLAGAQGVPVWTLLHAEADWRWMKDREDSPWYPTMRLFRQEEAGNWKGVIDKVGRELKGFSEANAAPSTIRYTSY